MTGNSLHDYFSGYTWLKRSRQFLIETVLVVSHSKIKTVQKPLEKKIGR